MRLVTVAATAFLALTGVSFAQAFDTPEALLEAFYAPYLQGDIPNYEDGTFFSSRLQGLYEHDSEITPEGEMGAIEFDPFIAGQDFDLTDFAIDTPVIADDTATADVSFNNFDTPVTLSYDLVWEDDSWKIDDVISTDADNPYSLSEIFAAAE